MNLTNNSLRLLAPALAALILLLFASAAHAEYEQVPEQFGLSAEARAFLNGEVRGLAMNQAGVGGVPAGSIYAATRGSTGPIAVVRLSPGAEGEAPQFEEAWGWEIGSVDGSGFQRCGPALTTDPAQHTYHSCSSNGGSPPQTDELHHFASLSGIAVDQANGFVYVRNASANNRKTHLVEVFTAKGAPVGEGFGDKATGFESIAESPAKIHEASTVEIESMTIGDDGTVYLTDRDFVEVAKPEIFRVMSFAPAGGTDFEHYEYTGTANDLRMPENEFPRRIAWAGHDHLLTAKPEQLHEYSLDPLSNKAVCNSAISGKLDALTANPLTGEVFYFNQAKSTLVRLGPCNEATHKFPLIQQLEPEPTTELVKAMAVDPTRAWSPDRSAGTLYLSSLLEFSGPTGGGEEFFGDIFAPSRVFSPSVESESVANTGISVTTLRAQIDPHGLPTNYAFQYLDEGAYEANEPNELQSLTVSAGDGLFGLGFEGAHLGGAFSADLSAGSKSAENLVSAQGVGDLHAANGTVDIGGARGKGTVIAGSEKVTGVAASQGTFAIGQTVVAEGIPAGATITAISGSELTISTAATLSKANTPLKSGTTTVTALTTGEGSFEAGETIEGGGIAFGTTIKSTTATELVLSKPTEGPGTAVAISAGVKSLTGVVVGQGSFEIGAPISGEGIPSGTTVTAVHGGNLSLSQAPRKPGTSVPISSIGPAPLALGEVVEGPGIPAGTTIVAAQAGKLTLSAAAEATVPGAQLRAGLPFDAGSVEVQSALRGLPTIGRGAVVVTGGPGNEGGSSPYQVEFTGSLTNRDLPELEVDSSGLSGGAAAATVATEHDGGEGFSSGVTEVPLGGEEITSATSAEAAISGLRSETRYRFRVIAANECKGEGEPLCETVGPPTLFATYPGDRPGLPDGRAYELVSPVQKNGGEVFPAQPNIGSCGIFSCKPPGTFFQKVDPMQSSPDGDAVSYMGFPFSTTEGAVFNSYVSRRTAAGWQTTSEAPSQQGNGEGTYAYSQDLALSAVREGSVSEGSQILLRGTADPPVQLNLVPAPRYRSVEEVKAVYGGGTPDFSSQLFSANDSFTLATANAPEPPDPGLSGTDLYEWRDGDLSLVNVLPGNTTVASGAAFASGSPDAHSVSADGQRVFWTAGGNLYMREGGEVTRRIEDPGSFVAASETGESVLLSDGCLYELSTDGCVDLTEESGGFMGLAGADGELSRVYFVDSEKLPGSGANEMGVEAAAGKPNLYLYEAGAATRFVASLAVSDGNGSTPNFSNDWGRAAELQPTAEASPNGRYLSFVSIEPLTGHANVGPCAQATISNVQQIVSGTCNEVFLYDSSTGSLRCPSCNPTGELPLGESTVPRITSGASSWRRLPLPRYLTDAGRLFFDSTERLSAQDTNDGVEDLYEFEPSGVGSCTRADGCVFLISPGTGSVDSNFLAMGGEGGEEGSNVFFTTRERLLPSDTDDLIDLYDARVGGGFPEGEGSSSECRGEACQSSPTPPVTSAPGSSSFQGSGNEQATRPAMCPKGKIKKNDKCVEKQKKSRSSSKKKSQHGHNRTGRTNKGGAK
jgi:hypothetical protein